ncbi:MAG: enoyl-CoA hydratase [Chloroflexi bacterium]|nr:enoyl-CoA hydratase [Chloroflexota bacterium]
MDYQTIAYSTVGPVAVITLNRPEVRNAQNELLKEELDAALHRADAEEAIRVIILKGAGSNFSAGHDMKQFPKDPTAFGAADPRKWFEGDTEKFRQFVYKVLRLFLNVHYTKKPTIAQVHGHVIAGGWVLASMCDLIIASDDTTIADPVVRMGSAGVEAIVEPWDVGPRRAKELLWTGDSISADEAWRLGMVNRVVPAAKLDEETMRLAQKIALSPPGTVQATKRSINHALDLMGWRASHEFHTELWVANNLSDEHKRLHAERESMGLREFIRRRDQPFQKR